MGEGKMTEKEKDELIIKLQTQNKKMILALEDTQIAIQAIDDLQNADFSKLIYDMNLKQLKINQISIELNGKTLHIPGEIDYINRSTN